MAQYYIGTSGWHYSDWTTLFYPKDVTGYHELTYHAKHFNTVENNSSFYRIASEATYKTWDKMTPPEYRFSMKLSKSITHLHKLAINEETTGHIQYILDSTQVLGDKLGAILIQLPASFKYDLTQVDTFLSYFTREVRARPHPFDIAIELRNKHWFTNELCALLRRYNVALVYGQSSRWPSTRELTADIAYIRMHGPEKLFASSYTVAQLEELATYVQSLPKHVHKVYVYFNNDFHGYALANAKRLAELLNK
jgi:uncharacterized protein YecE (DUF72 family)